MNVRNFHDDLAMSQSPQVEIAIKAACHSYFEELLSVHQSHPENDKLGADYVLTFKNCEYEHLDVKIRKMDYSLHGDDRTACLELVANKTSGKLGWTIDPLKRTDWVLFYYIESGASHFYQARQLRNTVLAYLPELKDKGKLSVQTTGNDRSSYKSESLFVSHRELGKYIYLNSHRKLSSELAA